MELFLDKKTEIEIKIWLPDLLKSYLKSNDLFKRIILAYKSLIVPGESSSSRLENNKLTGKIIFYYLFKNY